ncbi:MAG TPA: MFS transporter [Chloroflexota bacterium]
MAQAAVAPGLDRRRLALLAVAHLTNDLYGYLLPALLAVLIQTLDISLTLAGVLLAVYQVASSFLQPYLGTIADRMETRWFSYGGLALAALASGGLGLVDSYPLLLLLALLAGLGSAAFHPATAAMAGAVAGPRRGRTMGLYITAGNFGLGLGPLLAAAVTSTLGLRGTPVLAIPGLLIAVLLYRFAPPVHQRRSGERSSPMGWRGLASGTILLLLAIIVLRSCAIFGITSFLTVWFAERGFGETAGSTMLSVILLSGAAGGLVGGYLSDRIGRDRIIRTSLLLGPVPALLMLHGDGLLIWPAGALTGFLLNGSFVVLTVRAQELMPRDLGMVSGLTLGLTIGVGGLSAAPMAALAQGVGLSPVLTGTALIPLVAAVLASRLPKAPARGPAPAA